MDTASRALDAARFAGALLALAFVACGNPTGVRGVGGLVFAVGGEGSSIFVVNPAVGEMVARPGPIPRVKGPAALSGDSSILFFEAADQTGAAIYALDVPRLRLRRWLGLDSPARHDSLDGLRIVDRALATAAGDGRLYVGGAYGIAPIAGEWIAVIDTATRRVAGMIGPLDVVALAALPAGSAAARGGLLAIGSRLRDEAPSLSWLWVIDPATQRIVDSASVTPPNPGSGGTLTGLNVSPDGEHVYLRGRDGTFYDYDLVTQQVVGTAQLTPTTRVAISPDGTRLYAVDGGFAPLFIPASDSVRVFDARSLSPLPPISLVGQAALGGQFYPVHDVAVSHDGQSLYLAAGAECVCSPEPASPVRLRLLVMDLASGVITRVIPLGDYGTVSLLLGP